MGGPPLAVLFLVDAAMGFAARTVSQVDIFLAGPSVKIGAAFRGIALTASSFARTVGELLSGIEPALPGLLAGM